MARRLSQEATRLASGCATVWAALKDAWQSTGGAGGYRADAHYMRGPGPKWRAKYGPGAIPNPDER